MKPARTGNSRVFLTKGGACPENKPLYHSCVVAGRIEKPHSDVESIESPAYRRYGDWDHIGELRKGTKSTPNVSLSGRYALNLASELLTIARSQGSYSYGSDIQLHFGECKDPSLFYPYEKILLLEEAFISNWNIRTPKQVGNSIVNEEVTFQGLDLYEVVPLAVDVEYEVTQDNVIDITTSFDCCGNCRPYAITSAVADLVYLSQFGEWETDAITTLGAAEDPCCLALLGEWVVVFSTDSNSYHYASLEDIDDGVSNWLETTTGFTQAPTCCYGVGTMVWVGAAGGTVYKLENVDDGVISLESGTLDTGTLRAIHALDDKCAVAVGDNGVILYTVNQKHWQAASRPVGLGTHLYSVWVWDKKTWFVGDSTGVLWYTTNSGVNWTQKKDFS